MKALGLFAAVTVGIVLVVGWVLSRIWSSGEATHAVVVSGAVAVLVQLFAFVIVRLARQSNPIAAWGLGTLLRFVVLGLYAFVFVKSLGLASTPALVSLALFFFLSTLIEPLLLNV